MYKAALLLSTSRVLGTAFEFSSNNTRSICNLRHILANFNYFPHGDRVTDWSKSLNMQVCCALAIKGPRRASLDSQPISVELKFFINFNLKSRMVVILQRIFLASLLNGCHWQEEFKREFPFALNLLITLPDVQRRSNKKIFYLHIHVPLTH